MFRERQVKSCFIMKVFGYGKQNKKPMIMTSLPSRLCPKWSVRISYHVEFSQSVHIVYLIVISLMCWTFDSRWWCHLFLFCLFCFFKAWAFFERWSLARGSGSSVGGLWELFPGLLLAWAFSAFWSTQMWISSGLTPWWTESLKPWAKVNSLTL